MTSPRKRLGLAVLLIVLVLIGAGVVLLSHKDASNKTASGTPTPAATVTSDAAGTSVATGTSTSAANQDPTVQQLTQQYLSSPPAQGEVLGTAQGVVYGRSQGATSAKVPGTLHVLAVQAGVSSTLVRFSLATETTTDVDLGAYQPKEYPNPDLWRVELIARSADLKLHASRWTGTSGVRSDCVCAWIPNSVGPDGIELSMLYPALPESVTQVQLSVPGFSPLTVPVTRD